jgi:hypothetical protein
VTAFWNGLLAFIVYGLLALATWHIWSWIGLFWLAIVSIGAIPVVVAVSLVVAAWLAVRR